jgi:cytochrome c-type biogenesis protein CcmF
VALGEPMNPNDLGGAWAMRLYVKPFVRWLWAGGLFMMLGGFVAAGDRRFRTRRVADSERTMPAATNAGERLAAARESHA